MSLFCTNVADVFFFSHDNIRMIPMLYSYIPICVAEKRCRQKWAVWESNLPMRDDECIENIIFGTTLCFFFTLLKKKKKKDNCVHPRLTHLRDKGSGQWLRGLPAAGGDSLRLLNDWLLCTCRKTLLFRSSSVVMALHWKGGWQRIQRVSLRFFFSLGSFYYNLFLLFISFRFFLTFY